MKLKSIYLAPIILIIVIVAGIIILPPVFRSSRNDNKEPSISATGPCDSLTTPHFCSLREKVLQLEKKKWDVSSYHILNNSIDEYKTNTLINQEEHAALKGLLYAKYYATLGNAIRQHCRTANTFNAQLLRDFDAGIQAVPADDRIMPTRSSLTLLLSNYRSAAALPVTVAAFISSKPYDATLSKQYYKKVGTIEQMEIINSNNSLMQKVRDCRAILTEFDNRITEITDLLVPDKKLTSTEIEQLCTIRGIRSTYYVNQFQNLSNAKQ